MLASIQKIIDIKPIENADTIEKAYVLGWQVVVKKDEFKSGDLCVFITIDSILPDRPEFAFLAKSKFRVRTIKLRGALSQGIIFPTSVLPFGWRLGSGTDFNNEVGQDVSEILGVTHYEKPVPGGFNQGESMRNFPSFIPKTDEERLQNVPEVINEMTGRDYIITTKCDGTSCTIFLKDDEFGVCARNFQKKESDESAYWQMARKYDLEDKLRKFGRNLAVQGEICGPGIQKNKLNLKEPDLFVFDIYDIDEGKYIPASQSLGLIASMGLKTVPVDKIGKEFHLDVDELLRIARGVYEGTQNFREGIVVRAFNGGFSETLRNRISFKVLNNEFLLKEKE